MTKILRNPNTKFGYEMEKDGKILPINSKTTDGYLKLPEIVNGRKLISLKQIERDMENDVLIIDDLTERTQRIGSTVTTKSQSIKASKIEELLKDIHPEIYEELERLAKIEALEAELKGQREAEKALKAQIEALKNTEVEA